MEAVKVNVELVGGPYCGEWWKLPHLPDGTFLVSSASEDDPDRPACFYEMETDGADDEHRASFVRALV